jgi:hypothetical protein
LLASARDASWRSESPRSRGRRPTSWERRVYQFRHARGFKKDRGEQAIPEIREQDERERESRESSETRYDEEVRRESEERAETAERLPDPPPPEEENEGD